MTKTRENGQKPLKMANNLKKADFWDLDPILKGEDEFFRTWCQYKKCRHWSKLAFYAPDHL